MRQGVCCINRGSGVYRLLVDVGEDQMEVEVDEDTR